MSKKDKRWEQVNILLQRSDLAYGFAALCPDPKTAAQLEAVGEQCSNAVRSLVDEIEGPIPEQLLTLTDEELLSELGIVLDN